MASVTELCGPVAATVNLLISNVQLAVIFLDLAEQPSATDEDRERRFLEAARAYEVIVGFVSRLSLTPEQYEAVMARLTVLRGRLDQHMATFRQVA